MTKSEATRQFIIEKSAPLFNTKGVSGTAMSDILEATQMAKGGVYGHFESKDALTFAVVDYNLSLLISCVGSAVASGTTATEKLFAFLDLFATPTNFPVNGGCPILNFGTEVDDTNPKLRDKIKQTVISAQRRINDVVKAGIRSGEFTERFDGKLFAIKMFTLLEGGTHLGRILDSNVQMGIIIKLLKDEIVSNQV